MSPSSFILLCSTQIVLNKSLGALFILLAKQKKKKEIFFNGLSKGKARVSQLQ